MPYSPLAYLWNNLGKKTKMSYSLSSFIKSIFKFDFSKQSYLFLANFLVLFFVDTLFMQDCKYYLIIFALAFFHFFLQGSL